MPSYYDTLKTNPFMNTYRRNLIARLKVVQPDLRQFYELEEAVDQETKAVVDCHKGETLAYL